MRESHLRAQIRQHREAGSAVGTSDDLRLHEVQVALDVTVLEDVSQTAADVELDGGAEGSEIAQGVGEDGRVLVLACGRDALADVVEDRADALIGVLRAVKRWGGTKGR